MNCIYTKFHPLYKTTNIHESWRAKVRRKGPILNVLNLAIVMATICVILQGHEDSHSNCRENIQVSIATHWQYGRGSSEMSSCLVIAKPQVASSQI